MLGWVTLKIVDNNKINAFKNVLHQNGKFFDAEQTSNAKVVQRILADSVTTRAVCGKLIFKMLIIQTKFFRHLMSESTLYGVIMYH